MKRNSKRSQAVEAVSRNNCPLISESIDGCYCNNTSSTKIEEAIYYCGEHFMECKIFITMTKNRTLQNFKSKKDLRI